MIFGWSTNLVHTNKLHSGAAAAAEAFSKIGRAFTGQFPAHHGAPYENNMSTSGTKMTIDR